MSIRRNDRRLARRSICKNLPTRTSKNGGKLATRRRRRRRSTIESVDGLTVKTLLCDYNEPWRDSGQLKNQRMLKETMGVLLKSPRDPMILLLR